MIPMQLKDLSKLLTFKAKTISNGQELIQSNSKPYTENHMTEKFFLSYDVAVIQYITSCHKNHINTRVKTLWREHVTSLTTSMSAMRFLNNVHFEGDKFNFKGSYNK